ncbi:MAG: hypothetical protein K0Q49_1534 [Haloplasmataceae bacterium]|jgi:ATP-dependent helicase/nuclease subunit B|nr:hypothetical protein [Haloplasmataceae bacterium]
MLNILTGRSGTGKTTKILNEIVNLLKNENVENIILFVPEQMSFQAEYEIAKQLDSKGYTKLQVFSFKRLAHRIFLEVGGANRVFLNDMAIEMMISKIIEENKTKFKVYNKLTNNLNFVSLIHEIISEFKSFSITPEMINSIVSNENSSETLKKKMSDINIIYTELIKLYGDRHMDNDDFYFQLSEKIKDSDYIRNSIIYIDGYHSYTTVELLVIFNLMKYCKSVTVLFTSDNVTKYDMKDEDNLFNLPYRTLLKLLNFASENKIKVNITHLDNPSLRHKAKELAFLEANYEQSVEYTDEANDLLVLECENPNTEVHMVARTIFNDVFNNKAKFSDYVIYTNNKDVYYPLIQNIFKLYDIPVFIDDKKAMLDHSLLNFIDGCLEVVKTNWRYEAIFRTIKTEMFMPLMINENSINEKNYNLYINEYRNRIDLLENYCLAHGISGNDWLKEKWEIDGFKKIHDRYKLTDENILKEKIINETKNEITKPLIKFLNKFKEASNVKGQVTAIFQLLIDIEASKKLDLFEKIDFNNSTNNMDLSNAKKHKQVYNNLVDLFEQLVEVCGEYQVSTHDFIKILQTGFKNMNFAIVPPAIDQVMVGTLKRSRFEMMGHFDDPKSLGVKKAFVLGVNEGEIPKIYVDNGLLTDKEREFISELDIELMPTIEKVVLDEYFIIYTVLTSSSEKLYLSYTLSNSEKKEAFKSEIIEKVLKMFPKLKYQTIYEFPNSNEDNLSYITTKSMTTANLLNAINLLRKGYDVNETWKATFAYYNNTNELKHKLEGIHYENVPAKLDKEDVEKLYSNIINTSISSVEKFNSCPYSYFLEKGLNVSPRDIQEIESMDIGDLYHETMKDLANMLMKQNKELHEIDINDISKFVNEIVSKYAEKMQRKYFSVNQRNQYLLYKIKESLINSILVMHYQSMHSGFKILAVEEKFGSDATKLVVEPKKLINGFEMRLKGFIDRIDVANAKEKTPYFRIIDYKSGNKDIDFTKIYYKLSLQLFTYLDVVLKNSLNLIDKEAKAAGVLYYHIQNSEIKATKELDEVEIKNKHYEEYKMNGYTLSDQVVSILNDKKLETLKKSDIINVTLTNNGYHKTAAKVLNEEDMKALRDYSLKAIEDSVVEITSGNIDIKPVNYNKTPQCKYCEYHSICKFDTKLSENQYNEINKIGDSFEIIEKIKAEVGGEKDE